MSAGVAGWIEFTMLRYALNRRIGVTGLTLVYQVKLWVVGLGAATAAWFAAFLTSDTHPLLRVAVVLVPFGVLYFSGLAAWGVPEARAVLARLPLGRGKD
jgi:putative peptidoglycan lipid II flippase